MVFVGQNFELVMVCLRKSAFSCFELCLRELMFGFVFCWGERCCWALAVCGCDGALKLVLWGRDFTYILCGFLGAAGFYVYGEVYLHEVLLWFSTC